MTPMHNVHSPSVGVNELDELDLHILLLLLQILLEGSLLVLRENLVAAMDQIRKEEFIAKRAKPNVSRRCSFDTITKSLSPIHFRRMFRMNRGSFDKLCDTIALKVGDSVFKPENCATDEEGEEDGSSETGRRKRTCFATDALGGSLSGELQVAVMLRLLAGASYLDLLLV